MKKVIVKTDGINIGNKWLKKGKKITLDDKQAEALIKADLVELDKPEKKVEEKSKK